MAKVTGIGGVFFKSNNSKELAEWYKEHLGFNLEIFGGAVFRWPEDNAEDKGLTVWHIADEKTDWSPGTSNFMINYRVDNMAGMIVQLREAGVELIKEPESHENGKFAWILDPNGNKIELWEPKNWDEANKNL